MYFINIKKLKQEIADNKFTEKRAFSYFLWTFMLFTVLITPSLSGLYSGLDNYDHIGSLIIIVATLIGIRLAYQANGGDSGHDFIKKYFAVSWVRGWQVTIPAVLVLTLAYVALGLNQSQIAPSVLSAVYYLITYTLVYYFVAEDLRELNKKHR